MAGVFAIVRGCQSSRGATKVTPSPVSTEVYKNLSARLCSGNSFEICSRQDVCSFHLICVWVTPVEAVCAGLPDPAPDDVDVNCDLFRPQLHHFVGTRSLLRSSSMRST